jgi:SAM-dependent methyltransferase
VTRLRLRPAHTPEQLARVYAEPHDHRRWNDHTLRVAATTQVARWMVHPAMGAIPAEVSRAADLSCGNGAILDEVPATVKYYGDLAPGYEYEGPIEQTIDDLTNDVDLFICSETLEHLDDPDKVLKKIRSRTGALVLSTPVDAWDDLNEEHYWAWSREDVEEMLTAAGFTPVVYASVDVRPAYPYCFGIWGAR